MMLRLLAALLLLLPGVAGAFPDRPLTLINPYATGSQTDAVARALAESFTATLGQTVVVTNREGGSGVVGMRALMASPADGHTLIFAPMVPLTIQPHLLRNTGLGPEMVAPICNVTENILGLMVRVDAPWRDLPALAAAARQRSLSYGSPGPNSAPAIGVARLQKAVGGEYVHVPFRSDAASLLEVKAGRVDFAAIVVASGVPLARGGGDAAARHLLVAPSPGVCRCADGAGAGGGGGGAFRRRPLRAARHAAGGAGPAGGRLPHGDGQPRPGAGGGALGGAAGVPGPGRFRPPHRGGF
jgi:tripartite-type tricarboxylate transporter receptor subunit TctC